MIQQTKFLGIPLRTLENRRTLVVCYYVFLLVFATIPLARHKFMPEVLIIQTLTIGGMFGGIKALGPVKPYSDSQLPVDGDTSPIQQLGLGAAPARVPSPSLDEREQAERDHAHYVAYRILRWSLTVITFFIWFLSSVAPASLVNNGPTLLWVLLVLVLSLPQSVILWTEPEPLPEPGLITLTSASR